MGRGRLTLDEALAKAARVAQALFEPSHLAGIPLVIIAKKVQQTVEGKHPKFRREAMPGTSGLAARNSKRDHHIAQLTGLVSWKRQHIRRHIRPAVTTIENAYAPVGNDGDGHAPPCTRGRNRLVVKRGSLRGNARHVYEIIDDNSYSMKIQFSPDSEGWADVLTGVYRRIH